MFPSPEPVSCTPAQPALISLRLKVWFSSEKKQTTKPESSDEVSFLVLWPALVITQLSAHL